MIQPLRAAAAVLLIATVPSAVIAAPARPAAKTDWARAFSATPDGGFRMGNPKAKLAVVEYGSLTCPHCRHFAETAVKPLVDGYVRTGKASYEFRPFLLNGVDLAATLIARCNGPARFFPMAETLYATQPEWLGKVTSLPDAELDRLAALPQQAQLQAFAKLTGLIPVAAAHGIAPARAETCLKDPEAAIALAKIRQSGSKNGVAGTPTIFVNGKKVPAYDWDTLQPFLKEAGG